MSKVNVSTSKNETVFYVEINFSEKRNILTIEIIQELVSVFTQISRIAEAEVVILSGKGVNFCAGGDLNWLLLDPDKPDIENIQEVTYLYQLFQTIYNCPTPVIGKVHGSVYGGGLGLTSVCDIVAAQTNTQFCFSELRLNLIPSTIVPFVLNKISASKAKELILSARVFSVEEAATLGLVQFVGSLKECDDYINGLIDQFISCDRMAVRQAKKLLNTIPVLPPDEIKDYCIQSLAERRKSPEVYSKISKFLKLKK